MDNIQVPAAMDRHLDLVQCHEDGGILLGASNLTGRYWFGSLWYYDNPDAAPDVEKCTAGVQLEAGLSDAQWLSSNKVLVGLDTGGVAVWELTDDYNTFVHLVSAVRHDDMVTSVSVSSDQKNVVSAAYDRCVKVWDLETLGSLGSYKVHSDTVDCVRCHPTEPNIFMSCSQDGRIFLWDTRKSKPVTVLDKSPLQHSAKCVAWQPGSHNLFAAGDEAGCIVVKDTRSALGIPVSFTPHTQCVFRLEFSKESPELLASASDDCSVAVTSVDHSKEIYRSVSHKDFVRGLSWKGNSKLYTCGWDSQVLTHDIDSSVKSNANGMCEPVVMDFNSDQQQSIDSVLKKDSIADNAIKCNNDKVVVEAT